MKKKAISLFLAFSMSLMMLVGVVPATIAAPNGTTVVAAIGTGGEIINGFYYENGKIVKAAGVVKVGDDYYYIGLRGQVFVGTVSVTADKANGLVEPGVYVFDEDGVLIQE